VNGKVFAGKVIYQVEHLDHTPIIERGDGFGVGVRAVDYGSAMTNTSITSTHNQCHPHNIRTKHVVHNTGRGMAPSKKMEKNTIKYN
jgi:hypothetical protein